jgi:hypothetical protein
MVKYTRLTAASLAIAALTLAACKGDSAKTDSLKNDSALAANLALAGRDSAAKPQLTDTSTSSAAPTPAGTTKKTTTGAKKTTPPVTKAAPAPSKPAPTPAPAKPTSGSIEAGTTIALASNEKICTNTNKVDDKVTATTTESVSGSNGVSIPSGATVNMTVTQLKRSENAKDPIVMEFRVNSISFGGKTYTVDATVASADVTKIRDESKGKDVQKVAIGAAAGAIAGKILGKSTKGAVIGGAAGAAAGAGVAVATANYQGCINQGAKIVVKLDNALTLATGN